MGPKTKSAHLLRWHYGDRVTIGQFSNSFPKHFSYVCEYAFRFDLSCSFCEYPFIFHCLHCSPSCFDPDSLLLAYFWLGSSWIDCISANKSFSSPKRSSRKPYTSSKQQEKQKYSVETTINFSCPPFRTGMLACACLCARSDHTPPILAGAPGAYGLTFRREVYVLFGVLPFYGANVGWGVQACAFVCALRLYPAIPGSGVRCGCMSFCFGSGCAPPFLAGVSVCVCLRAPSACTPPLLVGVCGVWVWVPVSAFTPPVQAGVLGCVCLCARSACTPPFLAMLCGVGVCLSSGLGCTPPFLARLLNCVCLCARHACPRLSWRGFVVCGVGVAWHLLPCRVSWHVVGSSRVRGTRWPLLLGTCPCALVVDGGVPPRRALWPRVVRRASSHPVPLGALVGFPVAVVPSPTRGLCPRIYWEAAQGTRRPAENRAHCACRLPLPVGEKRQRGDVSRMPDCSTRFRIIIRVIATVWCVRNHLCRN